MNTYKIDIAGKVFRVFINNLVHLCIRRDTFIGLRAHMQDVYGEEKKEFGTTKYVITFFTTGPEIVCEYTTRDMWEKILKLLEKHL